MAPLVLLLSLTLLSSLAIGVEDNENVEELLDKAFGLEFLEHLFFCRDERPDREPEIANMRFVLQVSNCGKAERVPLTNPLDLWNSIYFLQDRPTVIYLMGWKTDIESSGPQAVAKAFACRNDTNFIVLDTDEALQGLYRTSSMNTDPIGRYLAEALLQLPEDYVTQRVHLIGHSLGAQIAGYAGRHYKRLSGGQLLPRVTGLDPANPCFYIDKILQGLTSEDAQYVQIIHTNPGMLGTEKQTGHADFYVGGLKIVKFGCITNTCSHLRAVDYLVESSYPSNIANFRGRLCQKYEDLDTKAKCQGPEAIMGLEASSHGLFYVDVNRREPYGMSSDWSTFTATNSECGYCNQHNRKIFASIPNYEDLASQSDIQFVQ